MNRRMLFGSGALRALLVACLALVAAAGALVPLEAAAQSSPLAQAQQQYDDGKFADALAALQSALASGAVTGSEAVSARALLGRCQAKVGDLPGARKTFLGLLHTDPQFRLDEVRTPPDELASFQEALRLFQAQQEHESRRLPASLTGFYGFGSGANEDLGKYVALGGGDKSFSSKPMFGVSVRFPLAPRWSLDLEMQRLRATNEDTLTVSGRGKGTYELTATPIAVSVVYLLHDSPKWRASVFAGGGPMLNSYASDKFLYAPGIPLLLTDTKTGTYVHGGLEGEYVMHPKVSLTGRVLFRSAKATGMFEGSDFTQYASGTIANHDLDFSGFGASIGLRAYIGY